MSANLLQKTYQVATDLLNKGQPLEAEKQLKQFIILQNGDLNCERLLGMALMRQNKHDESIEVFKSICGKVTGTPIAVLDLVMAYKAANQANQAIILLQSELKKDPKVVKLWFKLGDILFEESRFKEANDAYDKAEDNDPARVLVDDAKNAIRSGNNPHAEQVFRKILSRDPEQIDALCGLAMLAMQGQLFWEAEELLGKAKKRSLYWPTALAGSADLYIQTTRAEEACTVLLQALKLSPKNHIYWAMYSRALDMLMQFDESLKAAEKSLKIDPEQLGGILGLGHLYRVMGDKDKSIQQYKKHIAKSTFQGEGYWGLADLKTYKFSDQEIDAMIKATENEMSPPVIYAQLHFSLAKAFESKKEFDRAFEYYKKGNMIMRSCNPYDSNHVSENIDQLIEGYNATFLESASNKVNSSDAPIFILGMPRTGSTLLEQILSSHSKVEATMELPFISRYSAELRHQGDKFGGYPQKVHNIAPGNFKTLHDRFMKSTEVFRHGAPHFIDKLPNNFLHIGLIHLMFPNAKIIDTRRDPMDTCLSLYKQCFFAGQNFSYDLRELGLFYQNYLKIMNHWNTALPGKILTTNYEDLVSDPEPEIRRLLEYCGLDFEEACLTPHLTKRAIRTASSEQVKQPITNANLAYWRNFDSHLSDLKVALGNAYSAE